MSRSSGPRRDRIVYSTGSGRICPGCRHPVDRCACSAATTSGPPPDGVVRVRREVRGRRGKTVTVVRGVPLDGAELGRLASELKRRCGAGGAVKDGVMEFQGDHRDTLVAELSKHGYTVKLAGG